MGDSAISIKQISFAYQHENVLENVSCDIPQNSLSCIVGPNGSGKSTLLKCITGLLKPSSGSVHFADQSNTPFSYVPQRESVDWDFPISVLDVVLMGRITKKNWFKRYTKADKEKALECIDLVGLSEFRNRQISNLSGGQQQRIFLARALARESSLLIMDEPFAAVDYATEESLVTIMKALQKQGITQLVVHHDLSSISQYFDYSVLLNKTVIASGNTAEVFNADNLEKAYKRPIHVL